MNAITVRLAAPADREAVTDICRAISDHDWVPEHFDYLIAPTGTEWFYVAEREGRVVGCYCLELLSPDQVYLSAMRIDPRLQGRGIGTEVCRRQVEQALELDATDVWLLSKVDNYPAHQTVAKVGFVNRGAWLVHDEDLAGRIADRPPVRRARAASAGDHSLIKRFRTEQANGFLPGVIASPFTWWAVKAEQPGDWDLAQTVVVPGENGLDGLMLLADTEFGLLVRWLDGTPEATADLLAFALSRMAENGQRQLGVGLPAEKEPLLAPLELDLASAFRCYAFHLSLR